MAITLQATHRDYVKIAELKRYTDGSGYSSKLSISSGCFSCSNYAFWFDDLERFAMDLKAAYDKLKGKARLRAGFEKDFLEIEVFSNGHVRVTGLFLQYYPLHQELKFGFECDQTFLPDFLTAINLALKG